MTERDADSILDEYGVPDVVEIDYADITGGFPIRTENGKAYIDYSIEAVGIHTTEPLAERGYVNGLVMPTQNWQRDDQGVWFVRWEISGLDYPVIITHGTRWMGERCTEIMPMRLPAVEHDGDLIEITMTKGGVQGYEPPPPSGMRRG